MMTSRALLLIFVDRKLIQKKENQHGVTSSLSKFCLNSTAWLTVPNEILLCNVNLSIPWWMVIGTILPPPVRVAISDKHSVHRPPDILVLKQESRIVRSCQDLLKVSTFFLSGVWALLLLFCAQILAWTWATGSGKFLYIPAISDNPTLLLKSEDVCYPPATDAPRAVQITLLDKEMW